MSSMSYVEHYTGGAFRPYVRELRTASSLAMLEVAQPRGDLSDPPTRDLVVVQVLSDIGRAELDHGAGRFTISGHKGDLVVAPPECATRVYVHQPNQLRVIALPPELLRDESGWLLPPEKLAQLCAGKFRNEWMGGLLDRLWTEAGQRNPRGRLYADTANLLLLHELSRQAGAIRRHPTGGLAPWQVQRVTDHLMAALDRQPTLAELAAQVGLTPSHFCRAFKQSTGTPPHRWLLARRMERAQELLSHTRLSVTDVGAAVGYNDAGQFATAFRKATGLTPTHYRKDRTE